MPKTIRPGACPACGGDLHLLGCLGYLAHYRCRNCGIQTNRKIRVRKVKTKIG